MAVFVLFFAAVLLAGLAFWLLLGAAALGVHTLGARKHTQMAAALEREASLVLPAPRTREDREYLEAARDYRIRTHAGGPAF